IRAGLHIGSLMSGVVSLRMPQFTVFGDTVNTASRMESNGTPGRVHVSADIARVLAGKGYTLERRGMIDCKGKGEIETFWVRPPPFCQKQRN
ncbi:nucleotide cyclase, partial [Baffinella frigidus]